MMYNKRLKRKPRRRAGWQYGGINILNELETPSSKPIYVVEHVSYMKMLKLLLLKFPENQMYQELLHESKAKALSSKQLTSIEESYKKVFSSN